MARPLIVQGVGLAGGECPASFTDSGAKGLIDPVGAGPFSVDHVHDMSKGNLRGCRYFRERFPSETESGFETMWFNGRACF